MSLVGVLVLQTRRPLVPVAADTYQYTISRFLDGIRLLNPRRHTIRLLVSSPAPGQSLLSNSHARTRTQPIHRFEVPICLVQLVSH